MSCPTCGGSVRRFGKDRHAHQRWQCSECCRTFTERRPRPLGAMPLPFNKATDCLLHLIEGMSIRSTERLLGTHRDTIISALTTAGANCQRFLEEAVLGVPVSDVQVDEIWGFVFCKEKTRLRRGYGESCGDAYCYVALERNTKLVLAWHLGRRCPDDAVAFSDKLYDATDGRFQLSTDGFTPYRSAVPVVFGKRVDFAQLVKIYGTSPEDERRYTPPRIVGVRGIPCWGNPDMEKVCTSHVERSNLTMRMMIRRLTRLTNGHSKKRENHEAALALYFAFYSFCRRHQALGGTTPAMACGLADHVWTLGELLKKAGR
jgi:transposase-like protein/IS1 family transposase